MAPLISKRADIILILKPWTESLPRNAALCPGRLHERKVTEWFNLRTQTETLDSFCFSLFPVPLLFFPFPRFFFVYRTSMFEFNDSHQRPFAARKIEITTRPRISILAMRMNKIICKYIEIYRLLCYCVKTKAPTDRYGVHAFESVRVLVHLTRGFMKCSRPLYTNVKLWTLSIC